MLLTVKEYFKMLKTVVKIQKEIVIMPRISNKYTFHFQTGYCCFLEEKCPFFYKNLLKRKFQSPIHQSSLSREFDINKSDWSTIY